MMNNEKTTQEGKALVLWGFFSSVFFARCFNNGCLHNLLLGVDATELFLQTVLENEGFASR